MEGETPLTRIPNDAYGFRSDFGRVKRVDERGKCGKDQPDDGYERRRVGYDGRSPHSDYGEGSGKLPAVDDSQ